MRYKVIETVTKVEISKRGGRASNSPTASVGPNGLINFNSAALVDFKLNEAQTVGVTWGESEDDNRQIGIFTFFKNNKGLFNLKVKKNTEGRFVGASFSAALVRDKLKAFENVIEWKNTVYELIEDNDTKKDKDTLCVLIFYFDSGEEATRKTKEKESEATPVNPHPDTNYKAALDATIAAGDASKTDAVPVPE